MELQLPAAHEKPQHSEGRILINEQSERQSFGSVAFAVRVIIGVEVASRSKGDMIVMMMPFSTKKMMTSLTARAMVTRMVIERACSRQSTQKTIVEGRMRRSAAGNAMKAAASLKA